MRSSFIKKLFLPAFLTVYAFTSIAQNQALDLSGTGNEVNVSYNLNTGGFTVEQWVYIPNATLTNGLSLVNQSQSNIAGPLDIYVQGDGSVTYWFGDGTSSDNVTSSTGLVTTNTWHHIAVVYDPAATGFERKVYLDGNATPIINAPANFAPANFGPVRIGRRADGFEGEDQYLDEVRIWSIPRDGAAIAADYNQELIGNEAGLDVYLRFENDLNDDAFLNLFQNGSLVAGSIAYTAGAPIQENNYALAFDGVDEYVDTQKTFSTTSDFTIEGWVNASSAATSNDVIIGGDSNWWLGILAGTGGVLRWSFGNDLDGSTDITDDLWHHVAVSYSSGTGESVIYLDGVIEAGPTVMTGATATNVLIGSLLAPTSEFQGAIDELRIWNTTRTASQINAFKNVELNPLNPGLVSYYDFSDGPNTSTLSDLKGGSPGLLTNMEIQDDWVPATHGLSPAGPLDTTNPTVVITSTETDPTAANPIPITFTFSEEVVGFDISDIFVTDGTPSNLSTADNIVFTADVTPSAEGFVSVDVFGSSLSDLTGNFNDPASTFSITYDTSPPLIIATTLSSDRTKIVVEFNEDVFGAPDGITPVDAGDFDVVSSGGTASVILDSLAVLSQNEIELDITVSGIPDGNEIIEVTPFATSVYDFVGNAMSTTQSGNKTNLVDNSTLSFDGSDDYVIVPTDAAFELQQYTLEAWVNFPNGATPQSNELYTIISKGSLASDGGIDRNGYNLTYGNNSGTIGLLLGHESSVGTEFMFHPITLSSDTWYHLAGTFDGTTMKLFIDGTEVLQNSSLGATDIDHAGDALTLKIGAFEGTAFVDTQKGLMDEVRIWDFAKNAAEISSEKDFILSGSELGLVAYYDFDDAAGTTLTDLVASRNGTLTNFDFTGASGNWASGGPLVTPPPPAAPTDLIGFYRDATSIELVWTHVATNNTDYLVEWSSSYDNFDANIVGSNFLGAASAVGAVVGIAPDQGYFFRVTAINGFEDASSQSTIEFATTEAFPGSALSFDGTNEVSVPHNPALNLVNSDFAIETWVYLNASGNQTIASKGDGNGIATNDAWILQVQSNKIALQLVDGGSTSQWGISSTNVPLGEWVHIAVSFTGTTATFYLNGVADGTHNFGFTPSDNSDTQSMYIGRQGSSCNCNLLDGVLDELKLWSAVKSDFTDRFNTVDLSVGQPNLVAYYPFDEGVGATVAVDASANINDGTISGAASVASTVIQDGVVSNTNDSGPGTLRAAIEYANANSPTTISFDIAGTGPWNIGLLSALPQITANNTIIDGTSQSGWTFGDANAMVTLNGSSVPVNNHGLDINASGVEVYGLIITGFTGGTTYGAINLETDAADNVIIGANAAGNIIHGNGVNGIYIDNADFTTIQGNWLGTNDGAARSENGHGISVTGTVNSLTIGGLFSSGEGNVISGAANGKYGIFTAGGGTSLVIRGNYIGTDATGNSDLHNEGGGINIGGTYTFDIGGVSAGQENVISGNDTDTNADGINIGNSASGSILNNKIGVGANGSTPLGNGGYGILFANSASSVLVDGNTISGNGTDGIYLGNGSSTLTVSNNIIGLTTNGLTALGNTNDGIRITDGTNIIISGNTISANGSDGIVINGDQTNLDINTNIVGLNINGVGDMVLDGDGVSVTSDNTFGNQANGIVLNLVDGASSGNSINGNLISGNGVFADANTGSLGIGIYINADTRGFTIQDNVIGLEIDEVTPQKNINSGIYINGLSSSVIGGTGASESNLIGYSGDYGIEKLGNNMNGVGIYANEFVCNEKGGISFASVPDINAPIISSVTPTSISGTTTAEDNSNIIIYEAEDGCNFDQGSLLVVDAVDAVSGGTWTVSGTFDLGKNYVALVVDDETGVNATLSASEFSTATSIPAQNALNFDGTDDHISFTRTSLPSGLTYEAWINTTSTANTAVYNGNPALAVIGDNDNSVEGAFGIHDGKVRYTHWQGTASNFDQIDGTIDVNDGLWHHIAVTHDQGSNEVRLFVDGILDVVAISTNYFTTVAANRVGSSYLDGSGNDNFFDGDIDEIRIWNTVINETDIRNYLYNDNLGSHPNNANLVMHYNFNQGDAGNDNASETVVFDQTTNTGDGNLNGFTLNGPLSNFISSNAFVHSPTASSVQATNISVSNVTETTADITWTNGNGQRRIVAMFEGIETEMPIPSDNQYFHDDANFSGGDIVDGTWYAVYNGYGNSVTITGLTLGTDYTLAVLEVNGPPSFEAYNSGADTGNPFNFTTTGGVCDPITITPITIDLSSCSEPNGELTFTIAETTAPSGYDVTLYQGIGTGGAVYDSKTGVDGIVGDTFLSLEAGDYTLEVINNDTGCSEILSFTIIDETAGPTIDVGTVAIVNESAVSALDGSIDLTTAVSGDLSYQWYAGTDQSSPIVGETFISISGLVTGDYTVQVTDNVSLCSSLQTFTVGQEIAVASPNATITTLSVPGGTIIAGSSDNLIYTFTIAASNGNITKQGFIFGLGGDATATDFNGNGWKLYESVNSDTGVGGASLIATTNIGDVAPDSVAMLMSGDILDGDTHYFYLTVDLAASATDGSSFNVALISPDPLESVGIQDPKNKVDGGLVDGNSFTVQGDAVAPTPIVSTLETDPTNANPIAISVDFGEVVTGFVIGDVVIGNGGAGNFVDLDGQNYTFDIIPSVDGVVSVDIAAAVAQDIAANDNLVAVQLNIEYDATAPVVIVDALSTTDTSPALTGTIDEIPGTRIDVTVNGSTYPAINNGDGTWTLAAGTITPVLTEGVFEVQADAIDVAGNVGVDTTSNELTIDATTPAVGVDALVTNVISPALTGTIDDASATLSLEVDGSTYAPVNNGDGTWTLAAGTITPDLVDGTYEVAVTATDGVGNVGVDTTSNELTVDATAPAVAVDAIVTNVVSPALTGAVGDVSATVSLEVDGSTYAPVNNGDGTWTLAAGTITPDLVDGTYEVAVTATDGVGNVGVDTTSNELTIDIGAPAVTITVLSTNVVSPTLTGTIDDVSATLSLEVDGSTYVPVNNGDGTWTLAAGTIAPDLVDGTYEVAVTATDGVGNVGLDATTNELTIDVTAPVVGVEDIATSITSPELRGTIDDNAAILELTVNGGSYSPANNGDGTWTLASGIITPSLVDGTYEVAVTATDAVGNVGTDATTDELIITQTVIARTAAGITPTSFTARWSQGLNAQSYELDLSTTSDFSSFVSGYENRVIPDATSTSLVVTDLDFSTNYYYRVRLVNTSNETSANSNVARAKTTVDVTTVADSLALVQIYDAVTPQGFNWETARLRDWDGVTLDATRTRVDIVNISNTGATGSMPNPFTGEALTNGGLSALRQMSAADNALTGLMDFGGTSIASLNVANNSLTFDDLEPLAGQGSLNTFVYDGQANVSFVAETNASFIKAGNRIVPHLEAYSLTIGAGTTASANTYRWFKDEAVISSGTAYSINGVVNTILAIDFASMGSFRAEITNTLLPGLTIGVEAENIFAVADLSMVIIDGSEVALTDPVSGYLLEAFRRQQGFDTLERATNVASTFVFEDVILGDYLCGIDPSNETLFIPTYFGDAFEWNEADTIRFRGALNVQVRMTGVPTELTQADGEGTLQVVIEEDFGDDAARVDARRRAARRKCGLKKQRSGGRTAQDDDQFDLIAYGETNDNGEFEFGFLPNGVYRFFVEYPGIPLDESAFVQFEVGEAGISDTDFKLEAFATADGIEITIQRVLGIILDYFKDLEVYPNPSTDWLKVSYRHLKSTNVMAELVDLSGNSKWSMDLQNGYNGAVDIDVSEYKEGIYLLRFYDKESKNESVVTYRVLIRR